MSLGEGCIVRGTWSDGKGIYRGLGGGISGRDCSVAERSAAKAEQSEAKRSGAKRSVVERSVA